MIIPETTGRDEAIKILNVIAFDIMYRHETGSIY